MTDTLRCPGAGRDADNEQALVFYFSRPVTDDEMRFLHDVMQRAVACMPMMMDEPSNVVPLKGHPR